MSDYDVLIAGYGPTGMVAAALLGRAGHRVAVLERYSGLYNLPRAATFDDETMRLFQKLGIAEQLSSSTRAQRTYDWVNADGQVLIRNHFADAGAAGWPEFNMMFQPALERELDALCRDTAGVEILLGHLVTGFDQTADEVHVTARLDNGVSRNLTTRYLIGSDGGNSTIQRCLGIPMDDYGFQEPWLVCDFALKRPVDLPMAQQYGDPDQPTSVISIGPHHHRFSFMLDTAVLNAADVTHDDVWQRVSRWISPDDAELIRVAPYTFRSTVATSWRSGRVLLAGDAAHQMPPFLGQGMCSGIRDAHNLAWKLDLILRGLAGEKLLDSYQDERSPHVRTIIERAVELGRIQTVRDREAARRRDEQLLQRRTDGHRPAAFQFPGYTCGFLTPAQDDSARGQRLPQGSVRRAGHPQPQHRFDDLTGPGWVLLTRHADWLAALDPDDVASFRATYGALIALYSPDGNLDRVNRNEDVGGPLLIEDVHDTYAAWFTTHRCGAVLVRPDWYVYGSAADPQELRQLLAAPSSARAEKRALT